MKSHSNKAILQFLSETKKISSESTLSCVPKTFLFLKIALYLCVSSTTNFKYRPTVRIYEKQNTSTKSNLVFAITPQ